MKKLLAVLLGLLIAAPAAAQTLIYNASDGSGTITFPVTVSGATSGGIPCFTASTTMASSAAIGAGHAVVGGGAGACVADSKVTITAPATGSTLTIADGKTATFSNTMTFAASSDVATFTFPSTSQSIPGRGLNNTWTKGQTFTQGTANESLLASTGFSVTGSNTTSLLDLAGTWNTSGAAGGITLRMTDTAVAATGTLLNLLAGASGTTSEFSVDLNGVVTLSGDTILRRNAAANLALGAADAASPVAQTISVQNVVAGTSNTAGADTTFAASQSTGNAAAGRFLWQESSLGSSGTSVNALQTVMSIHNSLGGFTGRTALYLGTGGLTYLLLSSDNGSISNWGLLVNGGVSIEDNTGNTPQSWGVNRSVMNVGTQFGWATTGGNTTPDTLWARLGAASIVQGGAASASPIAQTYSAQNSRAGTDSNVGGANLTIQPGLGTGTGTPSSLVLSGIVGTTTGSGTQAASAGITVAGVATGQLPSVVLGSAAIATNATDGFLYAVSGAGQPTGTPTTFTGRVPIYVDTTNNQLWMYIGGAWKQPKTPAGAAIVTWQ